MAESVSFNSYNKPHEVGLSLLSYRRGNRPRKVRARFQGRLTPHKWQSWDQSPVQSDWPAGPLLSVLRVVAVMRLF